MKKIKINYFVVVFIISSLLRIALGILNREANDNHLEVVDLIIRENKLSIPVDRCWECFQPKLYHFLGAFIIKLFAISSTETKILILQFISVIAGIITVYFAHKFLKKTCANEKIRLILFSLIAFNPGLIGINSQATNDSLVIMLSVAATYYFCVFLHDSGIKKFILMTFLIVLAAITKPNALFLLISFILILSLRIIGSLNKKQALKKTWVFFVLFLLLTIPTTAFLGGYYSKFSDYGDPTRTNRQKYQFPQFFNETFYRDRRPGTTSILNSFLTFRIIDLIKNPKNNGDYAPRPKHRTSLWAQLYGRANFVHFANFPKSWRTNDPFVLNTGRLIFFFALLPTIIFIYGIYTSIRSVFSGLKKNRLSYFVRSDDWIFLVIVCVYVVFIITYNGLIREFESMKAIFLFPALLAFVKILADGMIKAHNIRIRKTSIVPVLDSIFLVLVLLYVLNIACLIFQLA